MENSIEKIIETIKNTKGNISKDKVCNLIQRMGLDKDE